MNKPIEIPKTFTPLQIVAMALALLLTVGSGVYLMICWPHLPQSLPSHYNFAGQPDAWSGKSNLLFLYAINFLTVGSMLVVSFFPKIWNVPVMVNEQNATKVYHHTRTLLCNCTLIIAVIFTWLQVYSMLAKPLGPWFLPLTLITLFGQMAYSLIFIYKK